MLGVQSPEIKSIHLAQPGGVFSHDLLRLLVLIYGTIVLGFSREAEPIEDFIYVHIYIYM